MEVTDNYLKEIILKRNKLLRAIQNNLSRKTILQLWSQFIRLRDNYRCVICDSTYRISAHHICRKSLMPGAQFETGNGITLCGVCHKEAHKGFNGRPDPSLPMDEQGGEKIEIMSELFDELLHNAKARGLLCDEFYFLSENTLQILRRFQGYKAHTIISGLCLEQANQIWKGAPLNVINAILKANGFPGREVTFSNGFTVFYD
ncbi:HNH endonuclease [Acinetobacter seifertii]|uniref:HNH endonuclease n=1 Tax=Acinetobacter seifertii TaxID=1530123 RepID=UPI00111D2050|nr:HNH endonuclease [Acinetobacter seifertii]